jgi:predicted RNase H-like nuclease (RuvC/YqgF family)
MRTSVGAALLIFLTAFGSARVTQNADSQTTVSCNCTELQDNITELKNTIERLNESRNRYKELYLSENENITNREIRDIENNINYIRNKTEMNYNEINNIEQKIWNFSLIIGSLLSLNLLVVGYSYAREVSILKKVRGKDVEGNKESS